MQSREHTISEEQGSQVDGKRDENEGDYAKDREHRVWDQCALSKAFWRTTGRSGAKEVVAPGPNHDHGVQDPLESGVRVGSSCGAGPIVHTALESRDPLREGLVTRCVGEDPFPCRSVHLALKALHGLHIVKDGFELDRGSNIKRLQRPVSLRTGQEDEMVE